MSAKNDLQKLIDSTLEPGETIIIRTMTQVKGGQKRQLAEAALKGVALNLAATALSGGTMGVLMVAIPPSAWLVLTDRRFLLVGLTDRNRKLDQVLMHVPAAALRASLQTRLLNTVTITDVSDGQSLLRLNLGLFKSRATTIVNALNG